MTRLLAVFVLVLLQACKGQLQAGGFPAIIEESTVAARAELLQVISNALNGVPVTLAEDALTKSNQLVIERKLRRNLQGRIDSGRVRQLPEQFRLMIDGTDCVLVRLADETRYVLKEASCRRL